jgi:hypothetical protein
MKTEAQRYKDIIRKREKRFQKMSPANKRVAIAKDVIQYVKVDKKIDPQSNTYLLFSNIHPPSYDSDTQIQNLLITRDFECTACAVGSMFVSAVLRYDNIVCGSFRYEMNRGFRQYLGQFFSQDQIDLIESAFECRMISIDGNPDDTDLCQAVIFGKKYSDDYSRILAIMENIIENNGEFKPQSSNN